jgi:polar amino acid transport system substrate-binding protein
MVKSSINRNLRILLAFLAFLALVISMPSATYAASKTTKRPLLTGELRSGSGVNLPLPKIYTTIFSKIEKDINIQFELQQYPWNRAVMMASYEGNLIFGLSKTAEREKIFTFSEPVVYNFIWLITRSDKKFNFQTIEDLKGKTIGVVRGSQYGGEFDAQRNKTFKTDDDLDSHEIRLKKIIENRIDAMIYASLLENPLEVEQVINRMNVDGNTGKGRANAKKVKFSVLPVYVLKDDIRFAIRKDKDDGIIEKLNYSINKINQAKLKPH